MLRSTKGCFRKRANETRIITQSRSCRPIRPVRCSAATTANRRPFWLQSRRLPLFTISRLPPHQPTHRISKFWRNYDIAHNLVFPKRINAVMKCPFIAHSFFFFFWNLFVFIVFGLRVPSGEIWQSLFLFFFFREKKKSHWNSLQPFQKQLGKDHKSFCWQVPTRLVYTLYIFFRSDRFAIRDTQNLCFFFSFCAKKISFRFRGGWTFFFFSLLCAC